MLKSIGSKPQDSNAGRAVSFCEAAYRLLTRRWGGLSGFAISLEACSKPTISDPQSSFASRFTAVAAGSSKPNGGGAP